MKRKLIRLLIITMMLSGCSMIENIDGGSFGDTISSLLPGKKKGDKPSLAEVSSYDERLEEQWQNTSEDGYIWTITIHDVDEIDVMGLCTASYNVNLSASHIGDDMYGSYFGEFDFDYSAEMGGLTSLLTLMGGSVDYDTDGWFKNDQFTFSLSEYDAAEEEHLIDVLTTNSEYANMSDTERVYYDSLMSQVYDLDNNEAFEKESSPLAMWWDYNMPMTEGDMSGYFQMNGVLGGMVDGGSEVDSSGKVATADVRVAFGIYGEGALLYKFDERYKTVEEFENPIPYTLKVYPNNQVVATFYNSVGSPVTTKCYGTIDKIALKDTIKIEQ